MNVFKPLTVIILGLAFGCKTTSRTNSGLRDVNPGEAKYYAAQYEGGELVFYATDPRSNEVIKPLRKGHSFSIDVSGGREIKIDTFAKGMAVNSAVNYGYHTDIPWSCYDAYRFVNEPTVDGALRTSPTPPIDDFSASEECVVELDTEDRQWFAVTVTNIGDASLRPSKYVDNSMLKNLPVSQHPVSSGPLRPGEVNVFLDPVVLNAMLEFEAQFQRNQTAKNERNTCLRNGRAYNWLDIQAHFYCILPYSPHRSCYSVKLIEKTDPLSKILNPKERIPGLLTAFKESFDECFTETSDGSGRTLLTPSQAAAFKYVMFTKNGLMGFSIESQNELINKFYSMKPNPEKRPRRLSDPHPEWVPNQLAYDMVRRQQLFMLLEVAGKDQEKTLVGAWKDTPLPTQAEIDDLVKNSVADPDNNPFADYRPDAKPADMNLAGTEVLNAMRKGLVKYDDKSSRESCLTTVFSPTHWSDLQLHFYCILYHPRECYTYAVTDRKGSVSARTDSFKLCSTSTKYENMGWPWIMDPANDPMARVFQYVMFSQTRAFKPEQEQELINTLWGLDDPVNADPKDCLKKRPMRTEDLALDPTRSKGIHCKLDKVLPLKGKGY